MMKITYDPNNKNADAFDYDNFINTPNLCTVATSGNYCDLSGLPTIPTNNNQLANGCGYTTTDGSDINDHADTCGGGSSFHDDRRYYGDVHCLAYDTRYINHPAEYKSAYHEPEYKTVHHDAEYRLEQKLVCD